MTKLDVIKARTVANSLDESERKLKNLYNNVFEIKNQMNERNGLQDFSKVLDKHLEEMEEQIRILKGFENCLKYVVYVYPKYEELIVEHVEEVQGARRRGFIDFSDIMIPTWAFRLLG